MRGYMKATAALAAFALLVVVMGLGAQSSVLAQNPAITIAPTNVCSAEQTPVTFATTGGGGCDVGDADFTIENSDKSNEAVVEIQNVDLGGAKKSITIPGDKSATVTVVRSASDLQDVKAQHKYQITGFNGNTISVTFTSGTGSLGATKTVTVDNISPALLATRPVNNLIVKKGANITFSADITDSGSGFAKSAAADQAKEHAGKGGIQLWVAGNRVVLGGGNFTKIDGGWRVSATLNSTDIAGISANVPWYFSVMDKAGNPQTNADSIQGVTSAAGTDKTLKDDTFGGDSNKLYDVAFTGVCTVALDNASDCVKVLTGARTIKVTQKDADSSAAQDITGYDKGTGTFTTDGTLFKSKDADDKAHKVAKGSSYEIFGASLITVDGDGPTVAASGAVHTGWSWNASTKKIAKGAGAKSTSIYVAIKDTANGPDTTGSGLDIATVTPSAFSVSGNSVEAVLVVDEDGEGLPAAQRARDTVFLTLGSALGSSEKPTVTIASGLVKDKAGNSLSGTTTRKAKDGLGPNLTLSRSAALSKSSVTITVTADEQLAGRPEFTVNLVDKAGAVTGTSQAGSVVSVTALSYKTTVSASAGKGEYNVYAIADDTAAPDINIGAVGNSKGSAETSSFSFELDNSFNNGNAPDVDIADKDAVESGGTLEEVEAVDPMIVTINYADEGKEYDRDSYSTVTLLSGSLKVTAKDNTSTTRSLNIATEVSSPDNKRFTLPVLNPQVGTYELKIKGEDQAGNFKEHKLYWKVVSAKPKKIALVPGWNLISLPFQPGNPAINSVVPANHPADIVMTYDNVAQVWLVSRRDSETGLFTGDIAVMTANTAYFIRTDNYQDLSVLRPPVATAAAPPPPPPAVSVVKGWNLVPVISLAVPTPDYIEADVYFGTLALGSNAGWLKALTFDPLVRTWTSVTPGQSEAHPEYNADDKSDDAAPATRKVRVGVGKGYWLYATNDGVIIP